MQGGDQNEQSTRGTLEDGSSLRERIERNARKFETWIRFQINIEIISDGWGSCKGRGPIKMSMGFEQTHRAFIVLKVGVDEENPGEI